MMAKARRNAGEPVEILHKTEGHGFYLESTVVSTTRDSCVSCGNLGGSVAAVSSGTPAASGK